MPDNHIKNNKSPYLVNKKKDGDAYRQALDELAVKLKGSKVTPQDWQKFEQEFLLDEAAGRLRAMAVNLN